MNEFGLGQCSCSPGHFVGIPFPSILGCFPHHLRIPMCYYCHIQLCQLYCCDYRHLGKQPHLRDAPNPSNSCYFTGGSSSGCAYAVGTGLIPIALSSDGGGSIRIPAAFSPAYGWEPSHNRLSHKPGINHSNTCAVNASLAADNISLKAL